MRERVIFIVGSLNPEFVYHLEGTVQEPNHSVTSYDEAPVAVLI